MAFCYFTSKILKLCLWVILDFMKTFLFCLFLLFFSFFLDFYVWLLVILENIFVIGKFDEYFCDYLCTHQVLSLCSRMEFLIGFGEYVGSASLLYEKQKRSVAGVYFACVFNALRSKSWGIVFVLSVRLSFR